MLNINGNTFTASTLSNKHRRFSTEPKSYGDLKICFVKCGSASWQIDGKIYPVSQGDIIFLHENQKRCFLSVDSKLFELATLTVKRQAFYSTTHLSCFFYMIKKHNGIFKNPQLLRLLTEIDDEYASQRLNCFELISAKLTEFFVLAERSYSINLGSVAKIDRGMLKILNYIDLNFRENISSKQMSALFGMTESSFSRYFSSCNGISFKQYLIAKRIEYAVSLLSDSDMKIIDIAYECGFRSVSGFYDAFKKITGSTPNKFTFV